MMFFEERNGNGKENERALDTPWTRLGDLVLGRQRVLVLWIHSARYFSSKILKGKTYP